MSTRKSILPTLVIIALVVFAIVAVVYSERAIQQGKFFPKINDGNDTTTKKLVGKQFQSLEELTTFLNESMNSQGSYGYYGRGDAMVESSVAPSATMAAGDSSAGSAGKSSGPLRTASDVSHTNVQVEGVDEADIVKNDGNYIYTVHNGQLSIVLAFPVPQMRVVSTINLSEPVQTIFLNGDRLVVYTQGYEYSTSGICPQPYYGDGVAVKTDVATSDAKIAAPYYGGGCGYGKQVTKEYVYDVRDKEQPELVYNVSLDGYYMDSRMIGEYVYTITSKSIDFYGGGIEPPIYRVNSEKFTTAATDVSYFDDEYDQQYMFTSISSLNIHDGSFNRAVYLTGSTGTVYVSENNIYLTSTKWLSSKVTLQRFVDEVALTILPEEEKQKITSVMNSDKDQWEKQTAVQTIVAAYSMSLDGKEKGVFDERYEKATEEYQMKIEQDSQRTSIHKIQIDDGDIEYQAAGEVAGSVESQFSLDEHNGYLRIATTTGQGWRGSSENHLFVLNKKLRVVGSITNLAPGERIYSARFMGDRAYIVTFRQVDPLFVIDLKNPSDPKVLGYLKVTGYSDYLHPYDETHLLGIGQEATAQGRIRGVKIALFDVSDVENPTEVAKYEVKDGMWSYSDALYDHKAVLFSKEKNLLVIPMSYSTQNSWWQGAYVFNVSPENITLQGKVAHEVANKSQEYYYGTTYSIRRSLYMDNVLYTISDRKIKATDLPSIEDLNTVKLPYEEPEYWGGPIAY